MKRGWMPFSRRRHQRQHAWVIGGSVVIASLLLPLSANATTAKSSKPQHGGSVAVALSSIPVGLSPAVDAIVNENVSYPMEAIYGVLAYENPTTGKVILQFLKSITPSNHNKTWTLTLKKGIKFSDGTPLNAAAIAYTLTQQANPNGGYQFQKFIATYSWKVMSNLTLRINLPSPNAGFAAEVTQEFPWIGSPTAWAAEGTGFATQPVGAGAFKLASYVQSSSITVVPNPYYKGFAPGEPYLSQIVFNDYPSGSTQLMAALTTGQDQFGWLQGSAQFNQAKAAGMHVGIYIASGGNNLDFNTTVPPFNNVLAREAVSLALSHQGEATAWSPGTQAQTSLFRPTSPYYNPKYNFPDQNTAKATQLFQQLAAEGDPVNFTITDLNGFQPLANYMQAQLDQFPDVSVQINMVPSAGYLGAIATHNFQVIINSADYVDPWPALANLLGTNGPQNFGLYSDPATDKALSVIASTSNEATLVKEWGIVQQRFNAEYPVFTTQQSDLAVTYAKSIGGVQVIEYGVTPLWAQIYMK